MSRPYTITLLSTALRQRAFKALERAPDGYRVTFQEPRRSNAQNDRMHAMIRDVAQQVEYYGKKRDEEAWKQLFVSAYTKETEILPCLSGDGFTQIRQKTSKMSKAQLSELMELIAAYGAKHGVQFSDPKEEAA